MLDSVALVSWYIMSGPRSSQLRGETLSAEIDRTVTAVIVIDKPGS